MTVVVYIDVLFLLNFIVNYLLLLAAARLSGVIAGRWRLAAGAAAGALYAVFMFFPSLSVLFSLGAKILASFLLVLISFKITSVAMLVRLTLTFFAVSLILAGGMIFVSVVAGGPAMLQNGIPYIEISLKTLVAAALVCYGLTGFVFRGFVRRRAMARSVSRFTITLSGKTVRVETLIDTGCEVADPVTGRPVLVCSPEALLPLFPNAVADILVKAASPAEVLPLLSGHPLGVRFRLLPFRTVSEKGGLMLAFRPDEVLDEKNRPLKTLVALSPGHMVTEGGYAAVMGPPAR